MITLVQVEIYSRPLPNELGYDVQPVTTTNFGVGEVLTTRLPAPYKSSCYSNWTQTNYTDLGKDFLLNFILSISSAQL